MRSRPLSYQPTTSLHGTSTRYLCQPCFGHKVESINHTKNFDLEHRSLHASHTRPSPIIQIKNKRIRLPNTQIYGPNCQLTHQPYAPERRTIPSNLSCDQHKY